MGKPQMITQSVSAFSAWEDIDWNIVESQVKQLQMRIAKAIREKHYHKAQALQWMLTHSYYAKLLAIKRVSQNKGSKTAGVDKLIWRTNPQKFKATCQLKRRGYNALPLRRVYIPKRNGKPRPLGIPSIRDRAMQALYLLALEPISETLADKNSYGFRPKRSCADAVAQCFLNLAKGSAAPWVLEGDIKACFDTINHEWLLNNALVDKQVLSKWLKSGYVEQQQLYNTIEGTPQGGIISPTLLTLTLRGMEARIKSVVHKSDKVNIVVYADDFIVTGATQDVLETKVKPAIVSFLKERGLELSLEKTLITHIDSGFDFLGFNMRKYNGKLLITPAKKNVNSFMEQIRQLIKTNPQAKVVNLINTLNPKIRGWANYYRHVCSKATFNVVDSSIFQAIWLWARRRHPAKRLTWVKKKYFCTAGRQNWVFNAGIQAWKGRYQLLRLFKTMSIPIIRHIKIKSEANPYNPKYEQYFKDRMLAKRPNLRI